MLWQMYVLVILMVNCAAFMVSAPSSLLVAIRGQSTILGCKFPSDTDPNFSSLVITWQRQEGSQVVHSFYYGQDQLDRQHMDYRNRTALFVSELKRGNASLRMEGVGPKDVGIYLCIVSTEKGTGRAQLQLEYGVFYTEPRLSISVSSHNVTVQFETEGFPKPEVQWLGTEGQILLHHMELTESSDDPVGLYCLKSRYEAHSSPLSVTFTLKNRLLNQVMQRPVILRYGEDEPKNGMRSLVICLALLCAVLVIAMLFLLKKHKSYCMSSGDTRNRHSVSLNCNER